MENSHENGDIFLKTPAVIYTTAFGKITDVGFSP